jgi:hypothetical protein
VTDEDPAATDSRPCTVSMTMFLLRLPSEMRDHLIAKDFKDCTLMVEYADLLCKYSSRTSCTIATINIENKAAISAVSGRHRWEFSLHAQRRECRSPSHQGRSRRKTPGLTRRTVSSVIPHHIRRQGQEMQAWPWLPVDRKRPGRRELNALGGCMIFLQDD